MPHWFATLLLAAGLVGGAGQQSVEIDRTLQHVYGAPIMASDVRQVRLLRLLPEADNGDDRILIALENRLLVLREVSRQPMAPPAPNAIAARRQTWAASWPAGTDLPALMSRTGMTEQGLNGWFRDDLRIATYLDLRFGLQADTTRATRIAEWLLDLRRRANLTGR